MKLVTLIAPDGYITVEIMQVRKGFSSFGNIQQKHCCHFKLYMIGKWFNFILTPTYVQSFQITYSFPQALLA